MSHRNIRISLLNMVITLSQIVLLLLPLLLPPAEVLVFAFSSIDCILQSGVRRWQVTIQYKNSLKMKTKQKQKNMDAVAINHTYLPLYVWVHMAYKSAVQVKHKLMLSNIKTECL